MNSGLKWKQLGVAPLGEELPLFTFSEEIPPTPEAIQERNNLAGWPDALVPLYDDLLLLLPAANFLFSLPPTTREWVAGILQVVIYLCCCCFPAVNDVLPQGSITH